MRKLLFLLTAFTLILSCSSDETSTPVTPPPAPIVKYTITLSAGEGGTVSTTGGEYEAGQTVSVTATPQGEYLFKDWSDGNTNATRTITVSSNSTLTANFEKKKYPLTVNIEGEGEVLEEIVNAGRTTDYDSGTTVKLTAVPAEGWEFTGWTGAIESEELEIQILVNESIDVSAEFIELAYPFSNYHNLDYFDTAYNTRVPYLHRNYEKVINSYGLPLMGNQTAGEPRCSVVLDYNGDGYMDLMHSGTDYKKSFSGIEDRNTIQFFKGNKYGFLSLDEENSSKFVGMIHGFKGVVNDFNGDGLPDVLFAGTGIHGNQDNPNPNDGTFNREYPVMILNGENDNFTEIRFTELSQNYDHSVASGDIDNDGDVDIIFVKSKFPLLPDDNGSYEHLEYGKILVNDGNANFTIKKIVGPPYYFRSKITMELYDIDKDGYLDLFLSGEDDKEFTGVFGQSPSVVLFGNGKDFNNRLLEMPTVKGFKRGYDFNFHDYDNDGYTDVILYRTATQNDFDDEGYYVQIIKNNLNIEFIDVTPDVISDNYNLGSTQNPKFIMTSDFDGDGIIELFNNDMARDKGLNNLQLNPNAYNVKFSWEIINGVFVKEE